MPLTTAQLQALRTDITVTRASVSYQGQTLLEWWDQTVSQQLMEFYNQAHSPDYWVWKTALTKAEVTKSTGPDGTTFTWVGNGFITRSAGEHKTWDELFDGGSVDASRPENRQAFQDIFSGTGNAALNRTHCLGVARRKATYGERLLATGTGSTASPGIMVFEGTISAQEVFDSRNA